MHEPPADLTTPLGSVTAEFSKGRLTARDIAMVSIEPGFGISRHGYHGPINLPGSGWTEPPAAQVHDSMLADLVGKRSFLPDRAALVAAIRAAVAGYAATATAVPRLAH